jgi:membrane associated rhomboid family serine protease
VTDPEVPWVEICRGPANGLCQELGLVLAAAGIEYGYDLDGETWTLLVPPEAENRAQQEVAAYRAENLHWPPLPAPVSHLSLRPGAVLGYWAVLLAVHGLQTHRLFELDWTRLGASDALRLGQGEWWRAVTALTLHADGEHLLHNLIFGSLFGLLLAGELGAGLAWLCVVATGALGNAANAWLQGPEHLSLGASTGVFAGIGLLMAQQWRGYGQAGSRSLRRWAPPVMAAVFLGYLGTAGERTDVLAHLTGLVAGGLAGLGLGGLLARLPRHGRMQFLFGSAALALLAWCWYLALVSR